MTGLYDLKPRFAASLRRVEDLLTRRGVSADTLTYASLPVAVAAGAALAAGGLHHRAWWLLVGPLALVRMALNALDGAIARRTGTSRLTGAVANELVDRAADAAMLLPAVVVVEPWLAVAATAVAWGVAFVAVLAQALTGERLGGGPMGKPDRVLVLSVGSAAGLAAGPAAIATALVVIVLLGLYTVVLRVRRLVASTAGQGDAPRPADATDAEHVHA